MRRASNFPSHDAVDGTFWASGVPADADGVAQGKRDPLYYGLAGRLLAARRLRDLGPATVGRLAGLSTSTVRYIEKRDPNRPPPAPRIDVVERLAAVLGVEPGWLAYAQPREEMRQLQPRINVAESPPSLHEGAGLRLQGERERQELPRSKLGEKTAAKFPQASDRAAKTLRGLSGTAILEIEEGRSAPTVETLERLARALDVPPAWLAYGEGPGPTKPAEPAE